MRVATGRKISAKIWGMVGNLGHKAFLPLFFAAFALALAPAPAKAQNVDAWLVGYAFECCPDAGGQSGQFLVLAYGVYPLGRQHNNKINYFKYHTPNATSSIDTTGLATMQTSILGKDYSKGIPEVKAFQKAVGITGSAVDGDWGSGTWKALADYFKGLKEPEVKQIGSRKIRFVPLIKGRLDDAGQASLANAVENEFADRNKIPLEVLEHFLKGAALPPASQALGQAGQSRVVEDAPNTRPVASPAAPSGQQPTASTNSPNELISPLLLMASSLPPEKQAPIKAALQSLTPAEQEQAALLMDLSKTRADQLEEQLKLASNSIDELNIRLNNLQIEQTGLRRQLAGVEYEYNYLKQQLGNLPESLKAALAAEGILIPKDRGGSSQGFFGNIRKILSDGHAYMSVSKWHLIILLVLMLVFAALLLIKGLRLLRPSKNGAKPQGNVYKKGVRQAQTQFTEGTPKAPPAIEGPFSQLSQKLDQILTALGNKEPDDPPNLNADPNTSQALTKLEQEIAVIRQNHAEKIAQLLSDLNASIQNLNKAVEKAPPQQSQELKQILLALGASPKGSGQQEDAKALMEEINQKLNALKTQEILIQLDEIKKQTVEAIRESFDEIMNKIPDSQKAGPGQPDNAKSRQLSGMDIIRERLGYDR